jgi:type II secretory pathway pseudopilin PulG
MNRVIKRAMGRKQQGGFTLIEALVGGAILVVAVALLVPILLEQLAKYRGRSEGEYVARAGICASEKARSMGGTGSVTFALALNNGCFGENEKITGKGTASASLKNSLTESDYAMGACNVWGTNDGVYVDTVSAPGGECIGVIEGSQNSAAQVISVTPSGGSQVAIKAAGGRADLGAAGLTTACNAKNRVTVRVCMRGA